MMMLVDMVHEGLVVSTHRLIRDLPDFDADLLIEKCGEYFDCEKRSDTSEIENILTELYLKGEKAFGFYNDANSWALLTLKDYKCYG